MGQRHQYIVAFPELFYNQGNVNNKPAEARIIHHQWLYGMGAISALGRVVTLIANSDTGEKDHLFGRGPRGTRLAGHGEAAITAAISVDPAAGYFHEAHCYDKPVTPPQAVEPRMLDNNDGVTVLQFEAGQDKPLVCFASPGHLEGEHYAPTDGLGPWSPAEYLSMYYSIEQVAKFDKKDQQFIATTLQYIAEHTRPMSEEQLQALLPMLRGGQ